MVGRKKTPDWENKNPLHIGNKLLKKNISQP